MPYNWDNMNRRNENKLLGGAYRNGILNSKLYVFVWKNSANKIIKHIDGELLMYADQQTELHVLKIVAVLFL